MSIQVFNNFLTEEETQNLYNYAQYSKNWRFQDSKELKESESLLSSGFLFLEIPESKTIKINHDVGVIVGLPKFKDVSEIDAKIDPEDNVLKIVSKSIEKIFSGDQVFDRKDMDDADLDEFIGSLTFDQLGELGAFFDNAPRLATDVQFKCNVCSKEQTKHLTGLQNFF